MPLQPHLPNPTCVSPFFRWKRTISGGSLALLAAGVVVIPSTVNAAAYVFTNIVDSTGDFTPGFNVPSVNSAGTVAFYGTRGVTDVGIFKGSGGAVTPIATDAAVFNRFEDKRTSINTSGVVAFSGELNNNNEGLFKGSGGATTTIAQNAGPFGAFGPPSINASGNVAFFATTDESAGGGESISAGAGGAVTTIDSSTGPRNSYGRSVTINTLNTVAFRASIDAGGMGVFTGNGGAVTTIAQSEGNTFARFNDPSINDSGTVAFRAELDDDVTKGIYKGNGGPTTAVALRSAGLFSDFSEAVSINNQGAVAFAANLFAGGRGIYVDNNGTRDEVIKTGDALFGSTLSAFELGNSALNDAGQVAFFYQLQDLREGIALAVPEPASVALLLTSVACLAQRRRRS